MVTLESSGIDQKQNKQDVDISLHSSGLSHQHGNATLFTGDREKFNNPSNFGAKLNRNNVVPKKI